MKHLLSIFIIMFSANTWAGCHELLARCLAISADVETEESCTVSVCSNTSSHQVHIDLESGGAVSVQTDKESSSVLVNEHKGIILSPLILKTNLTCYTSTQSTTTYCVKDVLL